MAKKKTRRRHAAPARPRLDRETFDLHWFDVDGESLGGMEFAQLRLEERDGQRERILPHLAEATLDHHVPRKRVASVLEELGYEEAARFFAEELPVDNRARKGNFGEVVSSEHLIQRYGYSMPVFKLRHRDSDMPMRGEDIIAFDLDDDGAIVKVIVGEAKAVVRFRRSTVREALDRLRSAYHPRPLTLSMLANILYGRDEDELAREIDRVSIALTRRRFPRSNWIFLINQDQPVDPFSGIEMPDDLGGELVCVAVALPQLTALVNAVFASALPEDAEGD